MCRFGKWSSFPSCQLGGLDGGLGGGPRPGRLLRLRLLLLRLWLSLVLLLLLLLLWLLLLLLMWWWLLCARGHRSVGTRDVGFRGGGTGAIILVEDHNLGNDG